MCIIFFALDWVIVSSF